MKWLIHLSTSTTSYHNLCHLNGFKRDIHLASDILLHTVNTRKFISLGKSSTSTTSINTTYKEYFQFQFQQLKHTTFPSLSVLMAILWYLFYDMLHKHCIRRNAHYHIKEQSNISTSWITLISKEKYKQTYILAPPLKI